MENIAVGVALFVLIIVVGLIVSLRLSSSGAQRRAVVVAFVAMTVVAVLFCVFAMYASMLWTVPIFAVACIVVPIIAYTLMMRSYKQHHPAVTYRAANEAPRPIRAESLGYAVDAAGMPIAPSKGPRTDLDAEYAETHAPAAAKKASKGTAAEEPMEKSAHSEAAPNAGAPAPQGVEAMIEEYLIEENEDEDGLFEPELSPTLSPASTTVEETSTMMLTVPYAEGEERYLVVSESTSARNPILAYRRTTSSRLVPLSSTNRYGDSIARDPDRISPAPGTPVWIPLRPSEEELENELEMADTLFPEAPIGPGHAAPTAQLDEPFEEPEPFDEPATPSPSLGFTDFINFVEVEPEPEPEPAAFQPDLFSAVEEPEPVAEPEVEAAATEAVPVDAPAAEAATGAPAPAPSLFDAEPAAEAPTTQPAPAPAPAAEAGVSRPVVVPFQAVPAAATNAPAAVPAEELAGPAATASYESFMEKAEGLRAKGLFPVAARLYGEAAQVASNHADAHRAQFDEIACYVKCGQSEKARELAGKLRASRVLTRVERIKLDAIERMG